MTTGRGDLLQSIPVFQHTAPSIKAAALPTATVAVTCLAYTPFVTCPYLCTSEVGISEFITGCSKLRGAAKSIDKRVIPIYIYIYIYMRIHTYIMCIYIYICMYVCMYVCLYVCMYVCMYVYTCIKREIHTTNVYCVCNMYMHIYIYIYTHIHTYIYTYTHTHVLCHMMTYELNSYHIRL